MFLKRKGEKKKTGIAGKELVRRLNKKLSQKV